MKLVVARAIIAIARAGQNSGVEVTQNGMKKEPADEQRGSSDVCIGPDIDPVKPLAQVCNEAGSEVGHDGDVAGSVRLEDHAPAERLGRKRRAALVGAVIRVGGGVRAGSKLALERGLAEARTIVEEIQGGGLSGDELQRKIRQLRKFAPALNALMVLVPPARVPKWVAQAVILVTTYQAQIDRNPRSDDRDTPDPSHPLPNVIWARVVMNSGQPFHMASGKSFVYSVKGMSIVPADIKQSIPHSQFLKACKRLPLSHVGTISDLRGSSYLFAILTDPRVSLNEW